MSDESVASQGIKASSSEPVWTYRGYQLRPSEFTTAMVHFFRAEVQRANVWRQRLDTTTNWAVITTGAAISFAFSRTLAEDHKVIILNVLLVTLFLYIEARRDRYYELWSYRVRLMETDFFAAMLVPPFHPAPDWLRPWPRVCSIPSYPFPCGKRWDDVCAVTTCGSMPFWAWPGWPRSGCTPPQLPPGPSSSRGPILVCYLAKQCLSPGCFFCLLYTSPSPRDS